MRITKFLALARAFLQAGRRARTAAGPAGARLRLEPLEERCLLNCSEISGFVYNDANDNGLFDAGEAPIANSPIELHNAAGVTVGSAVTDARGFYSFSTDSTISTNPTTLTRTASVSLLPSDWTQSLTFSQFDPGLGTLTSVDIINAGQFSSRIKVESADGGAATVTATVSGLLNLTGPGLAGLVTNSAASQTFGAAPFDGVIDFGGTSGHDFGSQSANGSTTFTVSAAGALAAYVGTGRVSLTEVAHATSAATGAGNLITQISTDAAAQVTLIYHYVPSNCLRPGRYTVVEVTQPSGFFDGLESTAGAVLPDSIGTDVITVDLTGGDVVDNDFGEVAPASLAGHVYVDANDNGIRDLGETPLAGVTVRLTGTNDVGALGLTALTRSDGSYQFTGLRPGTYAVTEIQPAGYHDGKDAVGSAGGVLGNDVVNNIRLSGGSAGVNYDFGELLPASVSGFVFLDANNDGVKDPSESGIGGVTVTLGGSDDLGTAVSLSTTTAADGSYAFANLRPGRYTLKEAQPPAYLDGKDALGSAGGAAANDQFSAVVLLMGSAGVNYNFGELLPGSLTGYVYSDVNNDGLKGPREPGIPNVVVTLTGTDDLGNFITASRLTSGDGSYLFAHLRPGVYSLVESQPASYLDGKDTIGSLGGSKANDQFFSIPLAMSAAGVNYNFGELTGQTYSASGTRIPPFGIISDVTILSKLQFLSNTGSQRIDTNVLAQAYFVDGVYRALLNRKADANGLAMWVQQLLRGLPRAQFVNAVWLSAEHRGLQVDSYYNMFLNRAADAAGRAQVVNQFLAGATETDVAVRFLTSPEYLATHGTESQYVIGLYLNVLGRSPTQTELANWTHALQSGTSRAAAAAAFVGAPETYGHFIDAAYFLYLNRPADAAGKQMWLAVMAASRAPLQTLSVAFLASDEYAVRARQESLKQLP